MDSVSLREERTRVSSELRAKLTSLATLRSRLANAKTDVGRRLLHNAVDKEADLCRRLSAKLIELDDLISVMQSRDKRLEQVALLQSPSLSIPGVFPVD